MSSPPPPTFVDAREHGDMSADASYHYHSYQPVPGLPPALPDNEHLARGGHEDGGEAAAESAATAAAAAAAPTPKRIKKVPLTIHEALGFSSRGIFFDFATGQLRCSCNHKPCDMWALNTYVRHFKLQCHQKYEAERLDQNEVVRLRVARATFARMNPVAAGEQAARKKKKRKEDGERTLTITERRTQERHWMEMWKDAKNELRQIRQDLKVEVDEDVRRELMADIDGLKRRKGEWARLLGLNEATPPVFSASV
eukprot:CAMPEP_0172532604 /NCGR_PEP_ID=MMETSP1067-20121228/5593_1 /TAXON_ID=265564 ORGANISM="Thalassiosira punctigera, Strain Tpunct2005C2" /NCGR_SAMPLE_ID=MMETSP1067 /ASSEMBLY_ACC=CAM_ASM_000444 /LENGTH=253 /DNA_ID=CAMNT_0013317137 /DNA_START=19 /DNA_END=780 /DNA_ORIENTATION=+